MKYYDLDELFKAFFSPKPAKRGDGLGLAITKQLIDDEFGSSLSATTSVLKNTCFTIKFLSALTL